MSSSQNIFLDRLPKELFFNVLEYLDFKSLSRFALVCKVFKMIIENNILGKNSENNILLKIHKNFLIDGYAILKRIKLNLESFVEKNLEDLELYRWYRFTDSQNIQISMKTPLEKDCELAMTHSKGYTGAILYDKIGSALFVIATLGMGLAVTTSSSALANKAEETLHSFQLQFPSNCVDSFTASKDCIGVVIKK